MVLFLFFIYKVQSSRKVKPERQAIRNTTSCLLSLQIMFQLNKHMYSCGVQSKRGPTETQYSVFCHSIKFQLTNFTNQFHVHAYVLQKSETRQPDSRRKPVEAQHHDFLPIQMMFQLTQQPVMIKVKLQNFQVQESWIVFLKFK